MRRMAAMIFSVLALGFVFGFVGANTVLHRNGYEGVVVAIGEDVLYNPHIIDNLKDMFRKGSEVLFEATRGRAYFREVTIVVPATWRSSHEYKLTAGSGWLAAADLRVDVPHPLHGDIPYTFQPGGCGEPGSYIHLTPGYVTNMYHDDFSNVYGPPGKVLVHEWAHLRWGVLDEYGKHGTSYPAFYIGEDLQVHVTGCTADIKGWLRTEEGEQCHADEAGMPDQQCHFFSSQQDKANGSLMNLYFLDSVTMFCDNEFVPHNSFAPNAHNQQCNGRSVWEVITQHKDFKNNMNPSIQKRNVSVDLRIDVIQEKEEKPRFVLLLDLSSSMDQYVKHLYQAVVRFVRDLVPTGSLLSVVSFSNKSRVDVSFRIVTDDRDEIVGMIPDTYTKNSWTGIGGALEFVLQMVKDENVVSKGLMVVLITDGNESMSPYVATILPDVKEKGIIINTISFGPNATDSLEQWANETGGRSYYHSTGLKGSPSSLDALLFDSINKGDSKRGDQLLQVYRTTHNFRRNLRASSRISEVGEVILDSSVGRKTRFTFTQTITINPFSISVRVKDPDGQEYGQENGPKIYQVDNATRTVTVNILEASAGRWEYNVSRNIYYPDEVLVAVTSHPSTKGREAPIRVRAWMSESLHTFPDPLSVYAHVSQGYSIVLDAIVTAVIVPPTEDSIITFPLLDTGVGADISAGDGIYSAFFTQFSANGRYSLSATVSTSNRTTKLLAGNSNSQKSNSELFLPSASAIRRVTLPPLLEPLPEPKSSFRPNELKPSETDEGEEEGGRGGHDVVPLQEEIEAFTRFSAGGIFKVRNFQPGDQQPPGRVKDLTASFVDLFESSVTLTWTSPGDDQYTGTASTLELRYHERMRIDRHFQKGHEVTDNHLTSGDLTPRPAGHPHTITCKLHGQSVESLEGRVVFFALRAVDESGNQGNLSNVATAYFPLKKYARNFKEEQKVAALGGMMVLVALAVVIVAIIVFIASVKLLHARRRRNKRQQQLEEGGLRLYG